MSGKVVALLATILLLAAPAIDGTITCTEVDNALLPCLGYIGTGGNVPPTPTCCSGVAGLVAPGTTVADHRQSCVCLKQIAAGVPASAVALAATIPSKCGIQFPYVISISTDCSKVT